MRRKLFCLKITHFIPPVLALAAVVVWNGSQRRTITVIERDQVELRNRIETAERTHGLAGERQAGRTASTRAGATGIDWKKTSDALSSASQGGVKGIRSMIDLEHRLSQMNRDEMIAALDELQMMDLADHERVALEEMILDHLAELDPQYALNRFADRIESEPDGIGWKLSSALGEWAKTDLAGATAWFDRQIAAGNFDSKSLDGRSEMRTHFESALMESLLGADPRAAEARLADLPEDQRREALQQMSFEELSASEQQAYAAMVRQLVPVDEQAGAFAHIASELGEEGGFDKTSAFLDSINATPEERAAAAVQAAETHLEKLDQDGVIDRAGVDALRRWLERQAPDKVGEITGKALAEASQRGDNFGFEQASQLALAYQKESGRDDVLAAFLRSYSARSNADEARHLAGMITDETLRNQIIKELE